MRSMKPIAPPDNSAPGVVRPDLPQPCNRNLLCAICANK